MAGIDKAFSSYRASFPIRPPDSDEIKSDDEVKQLTPDEGLKSLTIAPALEIVVGTPPYAHGQSASEKYLWVVGTINIPFALEILPNANFERGRLSHTNLTGGKAAHSGGEMWFVDNSSIVLNGGSGRYQPRSPEELQAVALAIRNSGYRVASMGWDEGTGAPARILRGDPQWL